MFRHYTVGAVRVIEIVFLGFFRPDWRGEVLLSFTSFGAKRAFLGAASAAALCQRCLRTLARLRSSGVFPASFREPRPAHRQGFGSFFLKTDLQNAVFFRGGERGIWRGGLP